MISARDVRLVVDGNEIGKGWQSVWVALCNPACWTVYIDNGIFKCSTSDGTSSLPSILGLVDTCTQLHVVLSPSQSPVLPGFGERFQAF